MNKEPVVIAVIPAYNEEANIGHVIQEAHKYVSRVIVCDDGSTDVTSDIAKSLGAIVVKHARNYGYGAALSTLFREARKLNPDAVVTLDADGQHDPSYIPKLVMPILRNGSDVVIGSRFLSGESEGKLPAYRRVGIRIITKLANAVSYNGITDAQSGFRAYSNRALKVIKPKEQGMGASTEILVKAKQANLRIKETPVVMSYDGKTSTENPVSQWFEVVLSTVKSMSIRRPQFYYGALGITLLTVALGFWIWEVELYAAIGQIFTGVTSAALVMTIVGSLLLVIAVLVRMLIHRTRDASTRKRQSH